MNKLLWTGAAALTFLAADNLRMDYARERALRITTESRVAIETTAFEMERDGEIVEPREGSIGATFEQSAAIVRVDRFLEGGAEGPTRLRRTYESIEGQSGMGERTRELESPWPDVEFELAVDENGDVKLEVLEGEEPADELLEGHQLELALAALLPEDEVEAGDEWELDGEALSVALALAERKLLFTRPAPAGDEEGAGRGRGRGRRGGGRGAGASLDFFSEVEWEGEARLSEGTEEIDGLECAVIELSFESEGDRPEREDAGGGRGRGDRGGEMESESTYSVELEGKLYYSKKEARPVRLELDGRLGFTSSRSGNFGERSFSMYTEQEGELLYRVNITSAESQ